MKLQEVMTTRPVVIPGGRYITVIVAAASLVAAVWLIISAEYPAAHRAARVVADTRCCWCCLSAALTSPS